MVAIDKNIYPNQSDLDEATLSGELNTPITYVCAALGITISQFKSSHELQKAYARGKAIRYRKLATSFIEEQEVLPPKLRMEAQKFELATQHKWQAPPAPKQVEEAPKPQIIEVVFPDREKTVYELPSQNKTQPQPQLSDIL